MLRSRRGLSTREGNQPMKQLQFETLQPPEGGRAPTLPLIGGQISQ